jgi:putative membrane protein
MDWANDYYEWLRALHVISVIAWMAGLFYLPRLFVYHAEATAGSEMSETFKVMERKLLRMIMNPAMIASYVFGGLMLAAPGRFDWSDGWIWVKAAMIVGLTVLHHLLGLWRKDFLADRNVRSHRYYRWVNETPTVMMIVLVIMVVVKPI